MIRLSSFGDGQTQLFWLGTLGWSLHRWKLSLSPVRSGSKSYLPCGFVEVLNVPPSVVLASIIFNVSTEELCLAINYIFGMLFRQQIKGLAFLNVCSQAQPFLLPSSSRVPSIGGALKKTFQPTSLHMILWPERLVIWRLCDVSVSHLTVNVTIYEASATCLHRLWGCSYTESCLLENSQSCISQLTPEQRGESFSRFFV